eukprot:767296-Amphidinium_carterae.3
MKTSRSSKSISTKARVAIIAQLVAREGEPRGVTCTPKPPEYASLRWEDPYVDPGGGVALTGKEGNGAAPCDKGTVMGSNNTI